MVLTAGHCICTFYDHDEHEDDRVNKNCLSNPIPHPDSPHHPIPDKYQGKTNQQTKKDDYFLNRLSFKVGNKDHNLATSFHVYEAYVMQTGLDANRNVVLRHLYDIGIILPEWRCYYQWITLIIAT